MREYRQICVCAAYVIDEGVRHETGMTKRVAITLLCIVWDNDSFGLFWLFSCILRTLHVDMMLFVETRSSLKHL